MESVDGKVAVITGAASGMGRAFAQRFGEAGAIIVAVDVEEPALAAATKEMRASGITCSGHVVDVSSKDEMEAFAAVVFAQHDNVHLLFNNAGVGGGGRILDLIAEDWEWVLGVNLFGVAHGLRLFLPNMVEHGDAHIINTASVAGHTSFPGLGPYNASKHAVVTISETLFAELAEDAPGVGVSVLCPGLVNTKILESDRNRPETLSAPGVADEATEEEEEIRALMRAAFDAAKDPAEVAELVYDAVINRQFYIFTDQDYDAVIAARHTSIATRTNPGVSSGLIQDE